MKKITSLSVVLTLLLIGVAVSASLAQAVSTLKAGAWNDPTVWSTGTIPNSSFGIITIKHAVNVPASYATTGVLTVDQVVVTTNVTTGSLTIDAGAEVTLNSAGAGFELTLSGSGSFICNGKLIGSGAATFTGMTAGNSSFGSGSTFEHNATSIGTANTVPTATWDANALFILKSVLNGTGTAQWKQDFGNFTINSTAPTGTVNFAGFLGSNGGSGAGRIKGSFEILGSGTGIISLNNTGTSTGTSAVNIDGHILVSGNSRLELTTTGSVDVNLLGNFTLSPTTGSISSFATTGIGNLRIQGTSSFIMSSGTLTLASGTGGSGSIQVGGDVNVTGGTIQTGNNSTGSFNLIGNSSNFKFPPASLGSTGNVGLALNKNSGQAATLQTDLTLSGLLSLASGQLILAGHILTANDAISQSGGAIDASTSSQFFIGGTNSADVAFTSTSTFSIFELNRAATTMTTTSSFHVDNLHLYNGTLTVNTPGVLTMNGGGLIERKAGALTNVPAAAAPYSVLYNNTATLTTGGELPTNATDLFNLTKQGTSSVTLNPAMTSVTINGDLTISTGSVIGNGKDITLGGNYTSDAAFTAGGGTFTFATGSGNSLSGTVTPTAPTFNNVVVNRTTTASVGFRVNANFNLTAGTFTATAGTANFGGTTTITNSGTINLNAVDILANSSVTAPVGTLGIAGDFTITNGTAIFTHNSGTLLFNGTTNLLGTGAKTFNNVSVSGTLNSGVSLTIAGNIINNGTISFTLGTLTLSGTAATITGTPVATGFFITSVSAGANVTSSIPFTTAGLFTVTGSFTSNNGFTSNAGVTIAAGGSMTTNTASFTITGNMAVDGILLAHGGFTANGQFTVSATGSATVDTTPFTMGSTFTVTGAGIFNEGTGADGTFLGDVAGTGTINLTALTTFAGNSTISGNGSKTFATIVVNSGKTVSSTVSLKITGDITNNGGTISFTAGTLTLGGVTQALGGTTPVLTSFFTTIISATSTVTSAIRFSTGGLFTINGKLISNGGFDASAGLTVSGTGSAVTVNTALYSIAGVLTINTPGTFTTNAPADGTISGNVAITGSITAGSLTTFGGTTTLTGASTTKSFNDVSVTGVLTPNATYRINGNLSVSGTLNPGTSITTFGGATIVSTSGTGTVSFYRVTISTGHSLTANCDITIAGTTFVGTGNFSSTGVTTFSRAGTTVMSGAGTKLFGGMTINAGTTLTPNAAVSIAGALKVSGKLNAGNSTTTFNGTTILTITSPGTVAFNSILISNSFTSDPGTITVNGNFTDNGTFNHGGGTIVFAGNTANRTLDGTSVTGFNNISISNGTQATDLFVNTSKDLFGVLTMAANARMDPDGAGSAVFTLRSTSDNPSVDASIAALPTPALSPAQINGKITVQRYTSGEGRIYRYISAPVVGSSVADWQDNFPITGTFSNPSNPGVVCGKTVKSTSPSLFTYGESTDAYVPYPTSGTAASNPLTAGVGYAAFVRECAAPVVIDVTGTMVNTKNVGTINLPVTFTAGKTNYNLVGNPYPSAIDFDSFAGGTNMSRTIAIRDNGTGNFQYWTNVTTGTNGSGGIPNGVIASGQAFWIQSKASGPALPITEAAKVPSPASAGNIFYREATTELDMLKITVNGSTQTIPDVAYVYQVNGALKGTDNWDATKLDNYVDDPFVQLFDLATSVDDSPTLLAVNALPAVNCNTKLKLGLNWTNGVTTNDAKVGTYSYTFNTSGQVRNLQIQLFDKFTNQATLLVDNGAYAFSITTDPASQAKDRFQLTFTEIPANLNLLVDGAANVCTISGVSNVIVKSAERGVSYFAMLGNTVVSDTVSGNGVDVSLNVANSSLKYGVNHFTIQALQACGQYTLNKSYDLTRDSIITAKIQTASHCRDGSVTLTASGAPKLGGYHWYTALDTTNAIAGQYGSEFITPDLPKTKSYYVAAVNSNGCEGRKVLTLAEIINYDDAAIALLQTSTSVQLQSNFASGNHWSLDGNALPDTSKVISIQAAGRYELDVKVKDCVASTDRVVTPDLVTGFEDTVEGIRAYPNPVTGVLSVEVNSKNTANNAMLSNTVGLSVGNISLSNQGNVKRGQYDFSALPAGMYYIQVGAGDAQHVVKVIKK